MSKARTMAELVKDGAGTVRDYLYSDEDGRRACLRELAETLVDMREKFEDPDGRGPDYTGRTWEYRDAAAQIYREVADEADPATIKRVKNGVRYHVNTALHARLANKPGMLERFGLQTTTIRDRSRGRAKQGRLLANPPTEDEGADVLPARVVHYARSLLASVSADELAELPTETREGADEALSGVVEEVVRLREGTTDVANTLRQIDDLLSKYRTDGDGRNAASK